MRQLEEKIVKVPRDATGGRVLPANERAGRLRIALVSETYPPELNGVSLTLRRAVAYLRDRGHIVDVIRPRQAADRGSAERDDETLLPGMALPMYPGVQFGFPAGMRLRKSGAANGPMSFTSRRKARSAGRLCTPPARSEFPSPPITARILQRALRRGLAGKAHRFPSSQGGHDFVQGDSPQRMSAAASMPSFSTRAVHLRARGLGWNDLAVIDVGVSPEKTELVR